MSNLSSIKYVDPFQWATQDNILESTWDLGAFERLEAAVGFPQEGKVSYTLHFYREEGGRALIKGHLSTGLLMRCERCLEPFNYLINNDFLVSPVPNEKKADSLPKHIEPLIILDKALSLGPFIEDEVLLNLPVVAWHAPEDCPRGQWHSGYTASSLASEEVGVEVESKEHPFAQLKALKEQLAQTKKENIKEEIIEEF